MAEGLAKARAKIPAGALKILALTALGPFLTRRNSNSLKY